MKKTHLAVLEGHLEHLTYYNKENHYTVARLRARQSSSPITIIGYLAGVRPGENLRLEGTWETHPKYGQQFKVKSFSVAIPASVEGIRNYLASGVIKGIGAHMADKLVAAFGEDTLAIIADEPGKLLDVDGIGSVKADQIRGAWKEHKSLNELMQFLQEMEVNSALCAPIFNEYGPDAVEFMRAAPYRLALDVPRVGFRAADTIARQLNADIDPSERSQAFVHYMLQQFSNEGHTFAYEHQLIERGETLFEVNMQDTRDAIQELATSGEIIVDSDEKISTNRAVYPQILYKAETGVANRLKAMLSVPHTPPRLDPSVMFKEVQKKLAISLSPEQLEALEKILSHRVSIVTGGPGTGKTTLVRSIHTLYEAFGRQILLAAPTGRAARRLSEMTRREAKTIHRMLEYSYIDDQFIRNQDNPLAADVVIVDEASMVDTLLMFYLLQAVPASAVLILVGDVYQLPSVGPGNVLSDLIESDIIQTFYLKKIFRQAQESPIIINAHRVREGEFSELASSPEPDGESEFLFIEKKEPAEVVKTIVDLISRDIPERYGLDPVQEVQVLTPMHKGIIGTLNLNQVLQNALNPNPVLVEAMGNAYKCGDKVMHLKNNYQKDVFNGDIGSILSIDSKKQIVTVDYYGRNVDYEFAEMDELSIAYAISVHKSQGSEYPAVIMPIMTQHYVLLQRNLLYTALTRGQKLVVLIGTRKALAIAVQNDQPRQRLSGLAQRLKEN